MSLLNREGGMTENVILWSSRSCESPFLLVGVLGGIIFLRPSLDVFPDWLGALSDKE